MDDQRSRLGAANLSVPLMLLTFVLVAGFLWWLNMNAQSIEVDVSENEAPGQAATPGATYVRVSEEELRLTPERYVGQVVQVSDLPVAMSVGTEAFFLDLPESPFLVKLPSGQPAPTGRVTVVGSMKAMNDSIIRDWVGRGLVPPGDQILVEFATHFIEASSIEPASGARPAP
jgi:hypothetical protein